MKIVLVLFGLVFTVNCIHGQNAEYASFIAKADSLYQARDYKNAGLAFSEAFKTMGWKGYQNDRYNAACSWALANVPDSAFFQLDKIVTKLNFTDHAQLSTDSDLKPLHADPRWPALLEQVKRNKEKTEANWDKALVAQLDSIYTDDQQYRNQMDDMEKKYGWDSKEMKAHVHLMSEKDSINTLKVKAILDSRGWLGADVVGEKGNTALFLVIQHSDIATQEKYLPMMRDAVKNGKAQGHSLALLEDRVALRQGKMQIYGSQIGIDPQTKAYYISPLHDPDNVDKRRADVGLEPLADYVSFWEIKWDIEQYKKDLPRLIELESRMR